MTDFEGAKYRETRHLDVTEVAGLMRADLADAKCADLLPPRMTYRVTTRRCLSWQGIDIHLSGMPDEWTYVSSGEYSPAAKAALSLVRTIHSTYNRGDDIKCHFYGRVELHNEWKQYNDAKDKFVRAARKRAADARKAAGSSTRGVNAQVAAERVTRQARAEFDALHTGKA